MCGISSGPARPIHSVTAAACRWRVNTQQERAAFLNLHLELEGDKRTDFQEPPSSRDWNTSALNSVCVCVPPCPPSRTCTAQEPGNRREIIPDPSQPGHRLSELLPLADQEHRHRNSFYPLAVSLLNSCTVTLSSNSSLMCFYSSWERDTH